MLITYKDPSFVGFFICVWGMRKMNKIDNEIKSRWKLINGMVVFLVFVLVSFAIARETHVLFYNRLHQYNTIKKLEEDEIFNELEFINNEAKFSSLSEFIYLLEKTNIRLSPYNDSIVVYNLNENEWLNSEVLDSYEDTEVKMVLEDEGFIVFLNSFMDGEHYHYDTSTRQYYIYSKLETETGYHYLYVFDITEVYMDFTDYFMGNINSMIISISLFGLLSIGLLVYIKHLMRKNFNTVMHKHRLEQDKLEELSYKDSLTKLYNRRYFNKIIDDFLMLNLDYSVIVADVNGLKLTNDAFGHHIGDQLLAKVSELLLRVFKDDIVFRWGGDEFLIISTTSYDELVKSIEIFHMESAQIDEEFVMSLAFGIAVMTVEDNIYGVMNRAERNMYEDKVKVSGPHKRMIIDNILKQLHEKHPNEEEHSQNVVFYSTKIGEELELPMDQIHGLRLCAMLHDVGKIAIPDEIISRVGPLLPAEYEEVQKHPEKGYQILCAYPELSEYSKHILSHHEHFDGTGYPNGLVGEDIPLISRIISVADAYDAMISERTYKDAININDAIIELESESGKQFDPTVVKALVTYLKKETQKN